MPEKLLHHRPSSLFLSLFLSLSLFEFLQHSTHSIAVYPSIYLSIFYLPREIHSRFLRSLFLLSPVRLLAFSQPFQWFSSVYQTRGAASTIGPRLHFSARYRPYFSLFFYFFSSESRAYLRHTVHRADLFFSALS